MTEILSAQLRTGTITVEVDRAVRPPEELFGFAERCNPKRAFLFVSKVLGRHIPVKPSVMRQTYQDLVAQIPLDVPGPVLVTGMAETAIGIGAGVHREYALRRPENDVVYLCSTRHAMGSPLLCEFSEDHSHATHHMIHRPLDPVVAEMVTGARTLIMVDDEASTGNTFVNLYNALVSGGLDQIEKIYLVTLTDWSDGRAVAAMGGKAEMVSMLSGRYSWTAREGAVPPELRQVEPNPNPCRLKHPHPLMDWGRLGVLGAEPAGELPRFREGKKVLVIGTGEHVWMPFCLAEKLEAAGDDVRFSSVTRSPIADGHAIGRALAFSDNYGIGVANFLYNVDPDEYEEIVLCVETPMEAVDPLLIHALGESGKLRVLSDDDIFLLHQASGASADSEAAA